MTSTANLPVMRAVIVAMPEHWVEERRRTGADKRDEVWDGVLHVPPEPSVEHQRVEGRLLEVLAPLARQRGWECLAETAFIDPTKGWDNYRKPDLVVFSPEHVTKRAVELGAELVVEVLSPHDESRDKFSFYAARGVREVWLIDPVTREIEIYTLRGAAYFGILDARSPIFGLRFTTVVGPKLRIEWADGSAEI